MTKKVRRNHVIGGWYYANAPEVYDGPETISAKALFVFIAGLCLMIGILALLV